MVAISSKICSFITCSHVQFLHAGSSDSYQVSGWSHPISGYLSECRHCHIWGDQVETCAFSCQSLTSQICSGSCRYSKCCELCVANMVQTWLIGSEFTGQNDHDSQTFQQLCSYLHQWHNTNNDVSLKKLEKASPKWAFDVKLSSVLRCHASV